MKLQSPLDLGIRHRQVQVRLNSSRGESLPGRFHQLSRAPITMMRLLLALPAPVYRPKVAELMLESSVAPEKSG